MPPIAVGIAAPGPLVPATGTLIDPPNLQGDWWGFPLAPTIGEALGLPWALGKDTNVNILGERDFGAGDGSDDLVYLTISTGIGGAVISGGRPITGPDWRRRRAGPHDDRHERARSAAVAAWATWRPSPRAPASPTPPGRRWSAATRLPCWPPSRPASPPHALAAIHVSDAADAR